MDIPGSNGARERSADVIRSFDPGGIPEGFEKEAGSDKMDGSGKWQMEARARTEKKFRTPGVWSSGPASRHTLV